MSKCKLCRHIMPTGRTCKSPAMRASAYCYFHRGTQKSARRASRPVEAKLEFEPISDPGSISLIADQILRAMASNKISPGRAAIMFQGLQTVLASYRLPPLETFSPPLDEPGAPSQQFSPNGI